MMKKIIMLTLLFFACNVITLSLLNHSLEAGDLKIIKGKVVSVHPKYRSKGMIVVKEKGKTYEVYTGWRTKFDPKQWPKPGEQVTIQYIIDKGFYKALLVITKVNP